MNESDEPSVKRLPTKLISAIFGSVGAVMLVVGVLNLSSAIDLVVTGIEVEGEVVSVVERDRRIDDHLNDARAVHPEVKFSTPEGEELQFRSSIGTSDGFVVGQKVRVLYPKGEAEKAQISSFFQLWFLPLLLLLIGLPLTFISALVFKFSSKDLHSSNQEKMQQLSPQGQRDVEKIMEALDGK